MRVRTVPTLALVVVGFGGLAIGSCLVDTDGSAHTCTVTGVFDYGQSAVQQQLTGIRHENDGIVSGTTHAHVSDEYCVELFVLRGTTEEIAGFVNTVRAVPDVRTVEYSILPLGAELSGDALQ